MRKKTILCIVLSVCMLLCSCSMLEKPPQDVGTVDISQMEFAEYTEIEPTLSGAWLDTPEGVRPYEAVWRDNTIYFLGKAKERQGLYAMKASEGGEILPGEAAELVAESSEGAQWSGLQSAGDLLIWEQEAENLPQERLAYNPEEGLGKAPFRDGTVMYWNECYYRFYGNPLDAVLERMTQDGDYETVAEKAFQPYEETCLQDGVFAYLASDENRMVRVDLETGAARDAVVVKDDRPDGVQCNEDWLVGVTDEGQIFAYSYETGEGHFVTQIVVDASGMDNADALVWLRGGQLWVLEEYQLAVYDLAERTVQQITLPGSKYSRWNLDAAGRLAGCDLLNGYIVTLTEG